MPVQEEICEINVHEAKSNFSSLLSEIARTLSPVLVTRYGRPIAKIVPVTSPARSLSPMRGVSGKIQVNCDLFADSADDWEACAHAPADA